VKLRADQVLEQMATTFQNRNAKYGDNWETVGKIFVALYPYGVQLKTESDFILFHWLSWKIGKLTRFINSKMKGIDSIHDEAVYSAMMECYIRENNKRKNANKHDNRRIKKH